MAIPAPGPITDFNALMEYLKIRAEIFSYPRIETWHVTEVTSRHQRASIWAANCAAFLGVKMRANFDRIVR